MPRKGMNRLSDSLRARLRHGSSRGSMAHVNCDPYEGGHLFALTNRVTCLFEREDELTAAVQALEAEGVATDDIDVFVGEQGAHCLDLSGRGHGRAVRLLRSIEDAVTDMSEANQRI